MAQKYYSVNEAASILGVSAEKIKQMLDSRELHGYRDGADWKFKAEVIEKLKADKLSSLDAPDNSLADPADQDVLLSEVELGESAIGASGTVIGLDPKASEELAVAMSDIRIASDEPKPAKSSVEPKVSEFEDLDLTLDADVSLDAADAQKPAAGGSSVDLAGPRLEDDDLVLGGSKTGSGVTLGADSGISLVDLADSGISLEEPLSLNPSGEESLELGEDEMLSLSPDTSSPSMKGEDDFQLTPLVEVGDNDDSESGSQVIALDSEGDEGATLLGTGLPGMAAMLEEDLSTLPLGDPMGGMPSGMGLGAIADSTPLQPAEGEIAYRELDLPEAPYTGLNLASLVLCLVLLIFCGMFMHDLMRNMWSWDGAGSATSPMMDWIIELFEGK